MKLRFCVVLICVSYVLAQPQYNYTTDSLAVRIILDSSGCPPVIWDDTATIHHFTVEEVSSVKNGRINALFVNDILNDSKCTTSTLNPIIGHLTELETLDVSANWFARFPDELFSLKKLKYLDMGGSDIDTVPKAIGNLHGLGDLGLCCSKISKPLRVLPEEIGNLDSLGILDLRDNGLRILPSSIGNLKNLWWLRLGYNQLDYIPAEIGNCTNLIFLELDNNNISILPSSIGNLDSLSILALYYNKLTELPSGISRLRMLGRLYLDHNQLHSLPDSIVLLDSVFCTVSDNSLCNQPASIQAWLDRYAGPDWRLSQIGCDSSAIKFKARPVSAENKQEFRKALIYDIRGRFIGISENGLLPGKFRAGIYILKSTASSGKKIKLAVVK